MIIRKNKFALDALFKKFKSRVEVAGSVLTPKQSPDEMLGELFQDVQLKRIYHDGITFADSMPAGKARAVVKAYEWERQKPNFDLSAFVEKHFIGVVQEEHAYRTNPEHTIEEHIDELWDVLKRENYKNNGSLMALPYPYIVPGGRFGAQWYWDSYFVMLGLAASGRWDLLEGMVKNTAFMLQQYGFVLSANRTYYHKSRSMPPFFALMVRLLGQHEGRKTTLVKYLPHLLTEYRFWMKGSKKLSESQPVSDRTVLLPGGEILNRYYDNKRTPRPEMYKEDVDLAVSVSDRLPSRLYLDLRAAAESGWDFSSRWFKDPQSLASIHTTDIVPVDLNCLLVILEQTIADAYTVLRQTRVANRYRALAEARKQAINTYCWDDDEGLYLDYDFVAGGRLNRPSMVTAFPLFAGVASSYQAETVAQTIKIKFLKPGGLVTTLVTNGQQWDAPNGWAPLQWVAIVGLRKYGHNDLAEDIKKRWIGVVTNTYKAQGKLVEKYNVLDPGMLAGGGEYALQDGFGWTNGVLRALLKDDDVQAGSA